MSGGIYEGPGGQKLHGDGRPVGQPANPSPAPEVLAQIPSTIEAKRRELGLLGVAFAEALKAFQKAAGGQAVASSHVARLNLMDVVNHYERIAHNALVIQRAVLSELGDALTALAAAQKELGLVKDELVNAKAWMGSYEQLHLEDRKQLAAATREAERQKEVCEATAVAYRIGMADFQTARSEIERLREALKLTVEALLYLDHVKRRDPLPAVDIIDDGTCPACHAAAVGRALLWAPRSPEGEERT